MRAPQALAGIAAALLFACASADEPTRSSRNGYSETSEIERYAWFKASVQTAAEIARQYDIKKYECIRDWYAGDRVAAKRRFESVLRHHDEKLAAAVVLMVLTEECGPLVPPTR